MKILEFCVASIYLVYMSLNHAFFFFLKTCQTDLFLYYLLIFKWAVKNLMHSIFFDFPRVI